MAFIQAVGGHFSPVMTQQYTNIDMESARKGIERIGQDSKVLSDNEKLIQIKELVLKMTNENFTGQKEEVLKLL